MTPSKSRLSRQRHTRGASPAQRKAQGANLAALLATSPSERAISLVETTADGAQARFTLSPLRYYASQRTVFGLITWAADEPLPPVTRIVQRADLNREPPQQLHILGRAPTSMTKWPRARLAGVLKALSRALGEITPTGDPGLSQWWLAAELACHGFAPLGEWERLTRGTAADAVGFANRITTCGPHLIWREHVELKRSELRQALLKRGRNPLRDQLTIGTVQSLLELPTAHIAEQVLELFAAEQGLRLTRFLGEPTVLLSGELAPPPLANEDARAVGEIMHLYAGGQGADRASLTRRYPGQQHLVHWLFDAGHLVETPDNYVFTRGELREHLLRLAETTPMLGKASVRDIKEKLKLKRRAAEALRAYLQDTPFSAAPKDESRAPGGRQ